MAQLATQHGPSLLAKKNHLHLCRHKFCVVQHCQLALLSASLHVLLSKRYEDADYEGLILVYCCKLAERSCGSSRHVISEEVQLWGKLLHCVTAKA